MKTDQPLVSIIVITYNSSKFVLETLESAKAQTYQNIELIISDDCSTDNTVEICKEWLQKHKERFQESLIITTPQNTGIPANCNRGLKSSKGEWIKLIAGDDLFTKDAIKEIMDYSSVHSEIKIIHCDLIYFKDGSQAIEKTKNKYNKYLYGDIIEKKNAIEQYEILLRKNLINAPSVFIKAEVFTSVGYFEEKFTSVEDHPFWLKATRNGFKFYNFNQRLIFYRCHENSISQKNERILFSPIYRKKRIYFKELIYPNIHFFEKFIFEIEFFRLSAIEFLGFNKSNKSSKIIFDLTNLFSPHYYYFRFYFPWKYKI